MYIVFFTLFHCRDTLNLAPLLPYLILILNVGTFFKKITSMIHTHLICFFFNFIIIFLALFGNTYHSQLALQLVCCVLLCHYVPVQNPGPNPPPMGSFRLWSSFFLAYPMPGYGEYCPNQQYCFQIHFSGEMPSAMAWRGRQCRHLTPR